MKAIVTSVGEKTTDICVSQLERLGFEVTVLDQKQPWIEKYKDFLIVARAMNEDVLRVDADVIVNRKAEIIPDLAGYFANAYMVQFQVFDFYKNDIHTGAPILYKKAGLAHMVKHLDEINDENRPETSLSRLPHINDLMVTCPIVMGMHGFFQDKETLARAHSNKSKRGQLGNFDFTLASELQSLL